MSGVPACEEVSPVLGRVGHLGFDGEKWGAKAVRVPSCVCERPALPSLMGADEVADRHTDTVAAGCARGATVEDEGATLQSPPPPLPTLGET